MSYCFINICTISQVEKVKHLGITFKSSLLWNDHINLAVGRTYAMLRTLWISQNYISFHIRMLLAKIYLILTLLYRCKLFSSCDRICLN